MEEKSLEEMMSGLVSDNSVVLEDSEGSNEEVIQESFMSKNIVKDLSVLEKEYVSIERSAAAVDDKIEELKRKNSDLFMKLAELEKEKSDILKPIEDYRNVIARKMFLTGEKKWKGLEVEFTYVAATFKSKFNQAKFKEDLPNVYDKYVDKVPVVEYIKTKLNLIRKEN